MANASNGGFCGALQRLPPTSIPSGLARRLANKENYGIGKVKVMLRVADAPNDPTSPYFLSIDKKKRQVTITEPSTANSVAAATSQERGPMVAAPKMFAFDNLFDVDDQQADVSASALIDVIPAVLEGSDGCFLTIGYPNCGQTQTMLGKLNPPSELGTIPCAISWLYKGINERRQKSGARFSVRVSAVGVCATKPESGSTDLLAAHATETDDSPGIYLRDDLLGGPTELRAPTAERAALYLDAAIAGRAQSAEGYEAAMIFTLHVYQYSLSRKGGVAGGRSRLHLIDLGDCANRNGGLPLSGIGNILLAILSGQRHPPNKDHPLTPLLKDCLAPLTCHVAVMAHVLHTQAQADALTTIQVASRIYRMRRRKHRFPMLADKSGMLANAGGLHGSATSSTGSAADPSSSELSADTVIYMGPSDDATDGEHPPVYLPSLSCGDQRAVMSKALKGTLIEKLNTPNTTKKAAQSATVAMHQTDSAKRVPAMAPTQAVPADYNFPHHRPSAHSTAAAPKMFTGSLRHPGLISANVKTVNQTSNKGSPIRRPGVGGSNATNNHSAEQNDCPGSPIHKVVEEQWVDGPRVSRAKVAEARHLMREVNHVKQCETWIDGPKSRSNHSLTASNLPSAVSQIQGYGFMDAHKKTMIREWVENQTTQVYHAKKINYHISQMKQKSLDTPEDANNISRTHQHHQQLHEAALQQRLFNDKFSMHSSPSELEHPLSATERCVDANWLPTKATGERKSSTHSGRNKPDLHSPQSYAGHQQSPSSIKSGFHIDRQLDCDEDQDSGPSEVPPALPLIGSLGSREISHESLPHAVSSRMSRDSLYERSQENVGLQVTEEEIARTMGSECPLTSFSNQVSSLNMTGDAFSDCAMGERERQQFDQLARLREIFTSQLAMAEMTPSGIFRNGCDVGSVYSEPVYRFNAGPESVCSEPPYRAQSPMRISRSPSQGSLPSLDGIMQIAGMDQYAALRHPDGASDPNLPKAEQPFKPLDQSNNVAEIEEQTPLVVATKRPSLKQIQKKLHQLPITHQTQLPLLALNTSSEAYDSGHDSSTPRTSKHSGISRRAESGYHSSVATARDSDESSFISGLSKDHHNRIVMPHNNKKKLRQDKSLCKWLINPFTCTYPETEGEISDF